MVERIKKLDIFQLEREFCAGATIGKRLLGLRVMDGAGGRLSRAQGLRRTAVKLLPWELVHLSAFALSRDMATFTIVQSVGLTFANLLVLLYALLLPFTRGARSLHDFAAGTKVSIT